MTVDKPFERIAIIGAGTMGSGIAAQIANAGNKVLLLDLPGDRSPNEVSEAALQLPNGAQLTHPHVSTAVSI